MKILSNKQITPEIVSELDQKLFEKNQDKWYEFLFNEIRIGKNKENLYIDYLKKLTKKELIELYLNYNKELELCK